jgi:hypothetical protein
MDHAQWMWMGVRPGPQVTRILIQEAPRTVLKACLPDPAEVAPVWWRVKLWSMSLFHLLH